MKTEHNHDTNLTFFLGHDIHNIKKKEADVIKKKQGCSFKYFNSRPHNSRCACVFFLHFDITDTSCHAQ